MITSQDIREKGFEKAVFGGYDMGQVDAFLEEIAVDIENIQKENVILKGKMKVLVNKIEEYRTSEDALQMAIVSAQKMGCMIEKESKEKGEALITTAQADAQRITREAQLEVEMELARLSDAKRSSAQFIENMRLLCQKQLDFLNSVGESGFLKTESAEISEEMNETVKSIEETVARAVNVPPVDIRPDIQSIVDSTMSDSQPTIAFSALGDKDQISIDNLNI